MISKAISIELGHLRSYSPQPATFNALIDRVMDILDKRFWGAGAEHKGLEGAEDWEVGPTHQTLPTPSEVTCLEFQPRRPLPS